MQRVHGGGNAVRAIACLPALVGAWRDPAGGALLSSSGTYPVDHAALERPDLIRGTPRTINMSAIGDALLDARDPPIRALYVYNSNPVAVAPHSSRVREGFAREDLFCVVHEIFRPTRPTSRTSSSRRPRSWSSSTCTRRTAICTRSPTARRSRRSARHCPTPRCSAGWPRAWASPSHASRNPTKRSHGTRSGATRPPRATSISTAWSRRGGSGSTCPSRYAPFAAGNFPTRSGKCEFASATQAALGLDPLPDYVPPREAAASNPELARRFPLAFISPPARNFLNTSFANLPAFVAEERTPWLDLNAADAAPRGIADGDPVRIFNDRGSFEATARVTDRARPGVAVAPSIWWQKLSPDGRNANAVTSQALTDMGRAATFYDCLVEVARA